MFELKGRTSLSKGFKLINRFSEDIDILIHPSGDLPVGKNQNKPAQAAMRKAFFDSLADTISIPGVTAVVRDTEFDDIPDYRGAGIRLQYQSLNPLPAGLKQGILLEAGFDQVAPNQPCTISSWSYDQALNSRIVGLTDNRALAVPCYEPGYTFVEKLQTISTKFRMQQESGEMPANFMRHYYDVYCLLADKSVNDFIGTEAYIAHKAKRFRQADETDLTKNEAFRLSDTATRKAYAGAYASTAALYYRDSFSFDRILERIAAAAPRL